MQPHKKQKSYQVLLSGKQLLWLSLLSFISLVICFYLGFVTGKSSRPPLESSPIAQQPEQSTDEATSLSPEKLSFFEMASSEKEAETKKSPDVFSLEQLEKLKQKTSQLQEAQKLRKEKEKKSAIAATMPNPPKPVITQTKPASPKPAVEKKKPAPPLVEAKTVGSYTLQVFTSSDKAKAEMFVKRLKENGYLDAYLHPYTSPEKKKLYRVRVAKANKATVESLAKKLKKLDYIEHVQVTRL